MKKLNQEKTIIKGDNKGCSLTLIISFFISQNKEAKSSAPAWAVAFCFAKQGGMYEHLSCWRFYCTELY